MAGVVSEYVPSESCPSPALVDWEVAKMKARQRSSPYKDMRDVPTEDFIALKPGVLSECPDEDHELGWSLALSVESDTEHCRQMAQEEMHRVMNSVIPRAVKHKHIVNFEKPGALAIFKRTYKHALIDKSTEGITDTEFVARLGHGAEAKGLALLQSGIDNCSFSRQRGTVTR